MISPDEAREVGLALAVELFSSGRDDYVLLSDPSPVIHVAGEFANWLLARPQNLKLRPAPFTFPEAGGPGVPTRIGENGMSVTMTDAQQVDYTCEPEDSKGVEVSDTLTWSSDDGGAVLTVTPSADGLSCTFAAVAPGSATITVTDGTLSGSDLITVTPGAVASLVLTPGTPAGEPSA
jgi:hypothetical protein